VKDFSTLFTSLDQTTKTTSKIKALVNFFTVASDQDKLWAIALFTHKRPRRTVSTALLRTWAADLANIPLWLFEETYHIVGDLAETIAKVIPESDSTDERDLSDWISYIMDLKDKDEADKKEKILYAWNVLNAEERFLFNKLITGGFRVGVSQKSITKALAKYNGQDENTMAHRLMGNWDPLSVSFQELIMEENPLDDLSKPYPLYLAYALEQDSSELGPITDWAAEWKWDGIRGQLIKRQSNLFLWSRGEELVTEKYPELAELASAPTKDFVIDGEILAYKDGKPMNFQSLQKRIGRKTVSKKLMAEVPVIIMAYDLLEYDGEDIRAKSYQERRTLLYRLIDDMPLYDHILKVSDEVKCAEWSDLAALRETSRSRHAEGFMLKLKDSVYKTGRKKGEWWKWKVDPLTIDAVMIYAMRGHGRRANLYTDFTFAVWDEDKLVPFTKAYSGLTDVEFREVTQFVKKNTTDKFGPVRSVKPKLVFEIAFEGINESKRHKSGIALRFPRIKHWRRDKPASEANTIEDLKSLLKTY